MAHTAAATGMTVAAGSAGLFGNTPGKESISALVSQSYIGYYVCVSV